MAIIILFRTLLFTCITISYVGECGSLSDAQSLYAYITGSVNKYLRPENNQSEPTELVLSFHLKSISGLNEVHGVLTSALSINVAWIDESISWNPNSYGGISEIKLHSSLIWVPDLILGNPANRISRIGLADVPVTIKSTGHVIHIIPDLLESTCDVDVTYFPFDSQKCVIEIIVVGYMSDIKFKVGGKIDTTHYSENNLWILASTKSGISDMGGLPFVRLSLSLKRRYSFFILNLFSPVLIMIMLNIMVFMLPPDSGERVGYAITCLLALSVYMTFASENLPISSKPIPILTYVLLVYVIISSLICLEVIAGLKFHLHDDSPEPPLILLNLLGFLPRRKCSVSNEPQFIDKDNMKENGQNQFAGDQKQAITWTHIGRRFDKVCFLTNLVSVTLTCVIAISITSNST